jgi:hypothetical protein
MGTGSFLGVKWPERGVDHPPPSNPGVEGRVKLYLCSPSGLWWPVLGRTLSLPLTLLLLLLLLCGCWFWQRRRPGGGSIITWCRALAKLTDSQQVNTSRRLRKRINYRRCNDHTLPLTHILSQENGTITGSSSPFVCRFGEHDHRSCCRCFKLDLLLSGDYNTVVVLTAVQGKAFWKDVFRVCSYVTAVTAVSTIR